MTNLNFDGSKEKELNHYVRRLSIILIVFIVTR
jgi:hypothetical protein